MIRKQQITAILGSFPAKIHFRTQNKLLQLNHVFLFNRPGMTGYGFHSRNSLSYRAFRHLDGPDLPVVGTVGPKR